MSAAFLANTLDIRLVQIRDGAVFVRRRWKDPLLPLRPAFVRRWGTRARRLTLFG